MTQQLLNCTICPKLPIFSDTSHLLTHVGSKGHLSHLHKLQVKSHQEVGAGLQLAAYNQWYQDHGLGQLLSERMLQKEAKQATKKANASRRGATIAQQDAFASIIQPPPPQAIAESRGPTKVQRKAKRTRRSKKAVDTDSDLDFSPIKCSKRKHRQSKPLSPLKRVLASDPLPSSGIDCPAEVDAACLVTPEHAKLKGIIWPGMDLFDAATSEMKKKRNQKKDSSVLRRMERLAGMVQPTEAVYAPSGELKKERHIEDLEDASSLIEGETPIAKLKTTQPRKRYPLAQRDANAPRLVKRRVKDELSLNLPADTSLAELPPLPYLRSSSTFDAYTFGGPLLPSEDDEQDFKPQVTVVSNRRRHPTFTLFNDGSPSHTTTVAETRQRKSSSIEQQTISGSTRPQLSMNTTPWLQPQHPTASLYPNPYASFKPNYRQTSGFASFDNDKENIMPFDGLNVGTSIATANPLTWRSPFPGPKPMITGSDSPYDNLFGLFPGTIYSDDPFLATKNPLALALPHLDQGQPDVAIKQDSDFLRKQDPALP